MTNNSPLLYAHIGDTHITNAKEQNYIDLLSIVAQIETECANQLDFVYLPGDNADNGLPGQYQLVATALKMLSIPVHIITGDHDMEQGSLDNFYGMPQAQQLPKALNVKGISCLFLDVCGPGTGGPDFRMGAQQFAWLSKALETAKNNRQKTIIFTHTYPADLKVNNEAQSLNGLIAGNEVVLVDMGHTHYNELANSGQTIFTATRSTGQIEEGPVGYSLISVDNGAVSWRFKPLHDAFPFVMITSPADYRLRPDSAQLPGDLIEVHAVVLGQRVITEVKCSTNGLQWTPMNMNSDHKTWVAQLNAGSVVNLTVMATDETRRPGIHTIQLMPPSEYKPARAANGSDADSIGAWPENGIFGTQLGPNRNGKPS